MLHRLRDRGRQDNARCLCERLVVSHGIRIHRKSWLWEDCRDQVGEGSRNEAASHRRGSGGSSKLQHGSLASILGGNDTDISRVFKGRSCQQKRLSGSVRMCDSDAIAVYCPIWKSRWVPP